jgi:hypothetical protein
MHALVDEMRAGLTVDCRNQLSSPSIRRASTSVGQEHCCSPVFRMAAKSR